MFYRFICFIFGSILAIAACARLGSGEPFLEMPVEQQILAVLCFIGSVIWLSEMKARQIFHEKEKRKSQESK